MEVQLTDNQKAFVRQAIESGRYGREEDALRDALSLWEERGRAITEQSMRDLSGEVKQRGRDRLGSEAATH